MSISLQTNVNSLIAQQNLSVTNKFQSQTIAQLTSGYRINSSGDDAAGLAVANKFRSGVAELTQGVANGNDAVAQLQIMDGGMNNISMILDRLKTLATQSASGTFTGNRGTLNTEFQQDLAEIDRQATSIGLNTGGTFAKSLTVYLGAGSGSGSGLSAVSNATVTANLTQATVDSQSLGMKGLQAVGGTTDIGANSTTSVQNIVGDLTNSGSEATPGSADFYFVGPGFSDSSKVKVSVNLSGVNDTAGLVTALNTAIAAAGTGTSQAGSAFQSANIVASAHTDVNGGTELAFTSSTSAFQVESGDRMANALLGNFTGPGSTTGAVIQTSVTGEATAALGVFEPANKTVQISGAGLSQPIKLTFAANDASVSDAITDLKNQVSQNAALKTAGISVSGTAGNPLVFTSARGESFSVMSTNDVTNQLGLGSFVTNASASNAVDYKSITGASYDYGSASTANNNQATMQFSINGAAATPLSLNLAGGDAVAAARTTTAISNPTITASTASSTIGTTVAATHDWSAANQTFGVNVNGTGVQNITLSLNYTNGGNDSTFLAQINSQLSGATASLSTNHLLITANAPGTTGSIALSGSTGNLAAGFTQTAATDGNDMLNFSVDGVKVSTQLSGSAAATITGAGTPFAAAGNVVITAASSGAAAGVLATPPTALILHNAVTFTARVDGGPNQTITLAAGTYNNNNTADGASYVHALNAQLVGAVASEASGVITITSSTTGVTSDVKITDGLGTAAQVTSSSSVVAADFTGAGNGTFTAAAAGGSDSYTLTRHDFNAQDYVADINYNGGAAHTHSHAILDPLDGTKIQMVSDDAAGSASAITLTEGTNTPLGTNLNLGVVIAHGDDSALTTLQLGAQTGLDNFGLAGNNQFLVSSDVSGETGPALVSIGAGTYDGTTIAGALNSALNTVGLNNGAVTPTTGVIASVSAGGSLVLSSSTVGALSSLSISAPPSGLNTAFTGSGAGKLGLSAQTHVGGSATAASLASTIQTAINTAVASDVSGNAGATVTVNNGGSLTITDNNKGAGHSISAFTGTAAVGGSNFLGNGSAGAVAGLNRSGTDMASYLNQQFSSVAALQPSQLQAVWTPGAGTAGTLQVLSGNNTSFRINSGSTGTATTATSTLNLSGGKDFTGLNSQAFQISTDGGTSFHNILLNTNTAAAGLTGATNVVSAINNALTAAGVAAKATLVTADPTHFYVQLASNATGSGASIQLQGPATGTASALASGKILDGVGTAETTADADLGFGVSGASFTAAALTAGSASSNLASAAPLNHIIDAGGASSANVTVSSVTNSLSFSALLYGNDKQAITIAANALDGTQQSTTITLKNLASSSPLDNRAGANIDTAISFINAQLQGSNNPTLQKIVAVKENNGGDQINFISSLSLFNVSVSSTANTGDGVNGGSSESVKVGVIGAGSNLAIDTQAGAQAAVTAISAAVGKLGSAQAAIGIGQNQLGYAISLANSQITNFSSAESQIRDANVAQQAANLSKAQTLSQASIAAMAQANSATQGVLALLRG